MQKHLSVWLTMLLWFCTNTILVYASLFESFLWWSSFWTNGELWRQRFKPLRLFEFHEGEEKLHLHCLKLLCSSSLLLPLQNTFSPGASSVDVNGAPGSGLSVKRLYTLSCCCVYLIISLLSFFQLCPPKFAMPLDLIPIPWVALLVLFSLISPQYFHLSSSTGDFPPEETEPDGASLYKAWGPLVFALWVFLFCFLWLFLHHHPSHISPATAFYPIFTCFTRLPLLLRSTVGHCAPHSSIHQSITPNFAIYCSFPLPCETL